MPDLLSQFEGAAAPHVSRAERLDIRRRIADDLIQRNGAITSQLANVVSILERDPDYRDRLRYSELHLCPEWREAGGEWVALTDAHEGRIAVEIERAYQFSAARHVNRAILTVAADHPYSPIRAYLEGLEWDGTPRIDSAIVDLFGGDDGDDLAAEKGRVFFLSAARRGLAPGCKVDTMLVLRGGQGYAKSSALKTIFGAEWFKDSDIPLNHSQDKYQALNGVWGYEIPEMDSFNHRDWNTVKAFLTSQVDVFRPSHARNNVTRRRACVFVGTTNEWEFLRDATGSRRFLVVEVARPLALDKIAADRDQLWAEAVHRLAEGEAWWSSKEVEDRLQAQNLRYLKADSWTDAVEEWIAGRVEPFSIARVLGEAIGIDLDRQDSRHAHRAREILQAAGCVKQTRAGREVRTRDQYERQHRPPGSRINPVRMWIGPAAQRTSEGRR